MNPAAILALLSDLYAQLTAAQQRIQELERFLEPGTSGTTSDPSPEHPVGEATGTL